MAEGAPEDINNIIEDDSDTNSPGIILMCRKCNNVMADSVAWVCSNSELRTITVHSVTNKVQVKETLSTSSEGHDIGSTYTCLSCAHCDSVIGKVYKTTPRYMDEMRDLFTLHVNALICYQIGGPDVQTAEKDLNGLTSLPDTKLVVTQINKMQSIILGLNERITKLEEHMKCSDSVELPTEDEDKENVSDIESGEEVNHVSVSMLVDNSKSKKCHNASPVRTMALHRNKSPADVKPNINKLHKKRTVDIGLLEKQRMQKKKKN